MSLSFGHVLLVIGPLLSTTIFHEFLYMPCYRERPFACWLPTSKTFLIPFGATCESSYSESSGMNVLMDNMVLKHSLFLLLFILRSVLLRSIASYVIGLFVFHNSPTRKRL